MIFSRFLQSIAQRTYLHTMKNTCSFSTTANKTGGNLYIWQGSSFTQSSDLKPIRQRIVTPEGVELDNAISKAVLGQNIMALITTDGQLYTQGEGKYGALGHNDAKDYKTPKRVDFFQKHNLKVIDVVCGQSYMMALTHDGDVWSWGWGGKQRNIIMQQFFSFAGALGHGDQKHRFSPTPVQALRQLPPVQAIAGGLHSAFVLNKSDDLYFWGRGTHGCFGDGYSKDLLLPRQNNYFDVLKKTENTTIKTIKSCNSFSVAQLSNGGLVGWGSNDFGQMGINNEIGVELHETSPYPAVVHTENIASPIKNYEIGEDILVLELENGQVYYCGMKLAYLPKQFELPAEAGKIKTIGAAFRSFAIVDENNKIYMKNKFLQSKSENIHTGVYSTDNSLFENGNILSIGGTYRNHYAIVQN